LQQNITESLITPDFEFQHTNIHNKHPPYFLEENISVSNWGFETGDATDWTVAETCVTNGVDTGNPHEQSNAYFCDTAGNGQYLDLSIRYNITDYATDIINGSVTINSSIWGDADVTGGSDSTIQFGYRLLDSSQTLISTTSTNYVTTGSYVKYSVTDGISASNTRYYEMFMRYTRGFSAPVGFPKTSDFDHHHIEVQTSYGIYSLNSSMNLNDNVYNTLTEEDSANGIADWYEENDVDNDSSDVDGTADIGTQGTFSNAQGTTLDSSYMNIQEGNGAGYVAGNDVNDYHDNLTDTDSGTNPDLGTYSNSGLDMDSAPDGTDETLTEENTAGGGTDALYPTSFDSTKTEWTETGCSLGYDCINAQGDSKSLEGTSAGGQGLEHQNFGFSGALGNPNSYMNITIYHNTGENTIIEITNSTATVVFNFGSGSGWETLVTDGSGLFLNLTLTSQSEINGATIEVIGKSQGGAGSVSLDALYIGYDYGSADNFEFDRQVGWTSVDFDETNEELCIFTGTIGTESLIVQVWTGSWTTLVTIVDANDDTWINTSITSYLTSAYFGIRFLGASESGDTTQNTWNIDSILIHVWTVEVLDYEINFEYQWTTANATPGTNTFAINVQNVPAGEDLNVHYWSGSWTSLGTITTNNWLNVTAIGLTTTYTIRLQGTSESGDTSQDSWDIDLILIRGEDTDTRNHRFDREIQIENLDTGDSYDNFELVINTGSLDAENIDIEIWNQTDGSWDSVVTLTTENDWTNTSLSQLYWTTDISFRLIDTTQSGDTGIPSTWEIDYFGIHLWSAALYALEWEHQVQNVQTGCSCYYYMFLWGNASEDMEVTFWDDGSNDWYTSVRFTITSTLQWYNLSIPSYAVRENITWKYVDTNRTSDVTADILSIDYVLFFIYNASINLVETDYEIVVAPFGGNTSAPVNPFNIEIDSGIDYNITLDCPGCGSVALGVTIYFDTDSDVTGATSIAGSDPDLDLYTLQPYTTTDLQFWIWADQWKWQPIDFEVDSHIMTVKLVLNHYGVTV
ncbi:MAG: hypothetical protein ACW980_21240, partial [Promethearchaeota archaeon]